MMATPLLAAAVMSNAPADTMEVIHARLVETFKTDRTKSYEWRAGQLSALRRMVADNLAQIEEAVTEDLRRPRQEILAGEAFGTIAEIDYTLRALRKWMAPEKRATPIVQKPGKSVVLREPKGVVLDIVPWNFPIGLAVGSMISAIAAGNCVLLKPSEVSSASERFLKEYIPRYLDSDAIAVVTGGVAETQQLLKLRWDHIVYTGNSAVAREVMKAAAVHLTPCTLELGGKSPTVVLPGADISVAAKRIVNGKCMNAGQICIAPDYALVHRDVADAMEAELKTAMQAAYGADAKQSDSFGRIINQRHFERVKTLLESTGDAEVYQLGQVDQATNFVPPTLVKNPSDHSAIMTEEIFGPVLPFITCESVDEIVKRINAKEKPLALYIFGKWTDADKIIMKTSSGGVCVNDTILHVASPELPFGGVGNSGTGCRNGKWGFDELSHKRAVMYRGTWPDSAARYAPYSDSTVDLLQRLMVGPLLPPGTCQRLLAGFMALAALVAAAAVVGRSRPAAACLALLALAFGAIAVLWRRCAGRRAHES